MAISFEQWLIAREASSVTAGNPQQGQQEKPQMPHQMKQAVSQAVAAGEPPDAALRKSAANVADSPDSSTDDVVQAAKVAGELTPEKTGMEPAKMKRSKKKSGKK